jgi:hypothetical protein
MFEPGFLQSVTIAVSAIGVIATIVWNRIVTRRKTTIEMMLSEQSNPYLLEIRSKFLEIGERDGLLEMAGSERWLSPQSFPVVSTLNRYEIIAIGINEGTIDAGIYKRYWRTTLVRDWRRCRAMIERNREEFHNPRHFEEFEALAKRWATVEERREIERRSN